jgi:hypothetical protein
MELLGVEGPEVLFSAGEREAAPVRGCVEHHGLNDLGIDRRVALGVPCRDGAGGAGLEPGEPLCELAGSESSRIR